MALEPRTSGETGSLRYELRPDDRVFESRLGGTDVIIGETLQVEAYSDSATNDFVVQTFLGGPLVDARVDLGAGRFTFPGLCGASAVSPPHVDCSYTSARLDQPFRLRVVSVPRTVVEHVQQELGLARARDLGPLHARPFLDPEIERVGQRLADEANEGNPRGRLYADHLTMALVRGLLRRSGALCSLPKPARRLGPARLRTLIDFMREHVSSAVQLDDLAQAVGMTRFELCRSFKATMGVSPWQYFIALRCEHAAELMAHYGETASLAFLSHECGFHDQSHFTRHFKQHTGLTPGKYRETVLG